MPEKQQDIDNSNSPNTGLCKQAAEQLGNFAVKNAPTKVAIREVSEIKAWVEVVKNKDNDKIALEKAVRALGNLALNNAANQYEIQEAGGIEALVLLCSDGNEGVKLKAEEALDNLARNNPISYDAIKKVRKIVDWVKLLKQNADMKAFRWAALALGNLAYKDTRNQDTIRAVGGIKALVELLKRSTRKIVLQKAAWALAILAYNAKNHDAIRAAGGIETLVGLVKHCSNNIVRYNAAWALGNLARNAKNQDAIQEADGIKALRELLSVDHKGIAEQAKGALEILQAQTTDQKEALNNATRASDGGAGKAASNNSGAISALPVAQTTPESAVRSDNGGEAQSAGARSRLYATNNPKSDATSQQPDLGGNAQEHSRNAIR